MKTDTPVHARATKSITHVNALPSSTLAALLAALLAAAPSLGEEMASSSNSRFEFREHLYDVPLPKQAVQVRGPWTSGWKLQRRRVGEPLDAFIVRLEQEHAKLSKQYNNAKGSFLEEKGVGSRFAPGASGIDG